MSETTKPVQEVRLEDGLCEGNVLSILHAGSGDFVLRVLPKEHRISLRCSMTVVTHGNHVEGLVEAIGNLFHVLTNAEGTPGVEVIRET